MWRLAVVAVAYLTVTATVVPFVAVPAGGTAAAAGNDCTPVSNLGDVSEGVTVETSGCYVVTQNHTAKSDGPSIRIAADDVRLVGAGGDLIAGAAGDGSTPTATPFGTPTDTQPDTPFGTPTEDGLPGGDGPLGDDRVGVFVNGAQNVTVRNLSVAGYDVGVYGGGASAVTVRSVTVANASRAGVLLDLVTGGVVADNTIRNATRGVQARSAADLIVARNEIVGRPGPGAAVAVQSESDDGNVTVRANRLHGVGPVGIRISGGQTPGVLDNVVTGVTPVDNGARPAGVVVDPGTQAAFLRNNTVSDVIGDGVRLSGSGFSMNGGTVRDTTGDGVAVSPVVPTPEVFESVTNLTVTETDGHGVALSGVEAAVLEGLTARDTGAAAVSVAGSRNVSVGNTTLAPTPGQAPPAALVYVNSSDGQVKTLSPVTRAVTDYGVAATVVGPPARFDDDGVVEVPYVATDGSLSVAEPGGESATLVADGAGDAAPVASKSKLAVGDWDGDGRPDVLYAAADGGLYRVDADETGSPTKITTAKQVQFVAGVADVTGDGRADAVYVTGSSGLRYVDGRTGEDLPVSVASTWGANNQIGFGEPSVVDGRLVAPRVGGSGEPQLQLFDGQGTVETLSGAQVAKTAPSAVDLDGDGTPAYAFVGDGLFTTSRNDSLTAVTGTNRSVDPDESVGLASRVSAPVPAVTTNDGGFVGRNLTVDGVAGVDVVGREIAVRGRTTVPPADGATALNGGVRIRDTGANATVSLGFAYTDAQVAATNRDESTVGVARYDGDTDAWLFPATEQSLGVNRVALANATTATGLYAPFVGTTATDETGPTATVSVVDRPGAAATVRVVADEPLATLNVSVDGPGPLTARTRETFTETALSNGNYSYEVPVTFPAGAVEVTLVSATDAAGNGLGVTPTTTGNVTARATVDDDGSADFTTVAAAVAETPADSVIAVANGTYAPANVTVAENTTLSLAGGATFDGAGVSAPTPLRVGDADLTVRGGEIRSYDTALAAVGAAGNVTIDGTQITATGGSGVRATSATGEWTLRGVTVAGTGGPAVRATSATGEWTLQNTTLRNAGSVGLLADTATGDWTLSNVTVRNSSGDGVSASITGGAWTVGGLTVTDAGATGVDASEATGDWSLAASRVERTNGSSVRAVAVDGDFVVNASVLAGYGGVGVNASEAVRTVDATQVYWDDGDAPTTAPNGSATGDCVGNVDCSVHLTSRPLEGGNETDPGGNETDPGGNETDPGGNETDPGGNETDPGGNETVEPPFTVDADPGADFDRIQPALDAAADGQRVAVAAGSYEIETALSITTNLTLDLAPGAVVEPTTTGGTGLVIANGSAPTVTGGTLDGFATAVDARGASGDWRLANVTVGETGVAVDATNATGDWTVRNVTVGGFGGDGILAPGTTGNWTVRDATIAGRETAVVASAAAGDWTLQRVTTTGADTAVAATNATGDWTVQTARFGGDVDATGTTGDWTVRNTTLSAATGGGALDASGATGDWTVRRTDLTNTDAVALRAGSPTGDWTVTESRLSGGTTGLVAAGDANWTVRNTTVLSDGAHGVLAAATGGDWTVTNASVAAPNGTAVAASVTTGGWAIRNTTLAGETAVAATRTEGAWTVTRSLLRNYTVGVDASDATVTGDATQVYWDDGDAPTTAPNGSATGDCVGNVDCSNFLTTPSGTNETDPGGNETDPGGNETDPGGNETDPGGNETDPGGNETVEPPFTVDDDPGADFDTIRGAVAAAGDGDRIAVRPGTYPIQSPLVLGADVRLDLASGATVTGVTDTTGIVVANGSAPTVTGGTLDGFATAVDARGESGDWRLANVTVGETGVAVDATNATGDWRVRNATVGGFGGDGILAPGTTGNWTVRNATLVGPETAVAAAGAEGDWAVRNVTVEETAQAVDARATTGDWLVAGLSTAATGTGVNAWRAEGDWTVRDTRLSDTDSGAVYAVETAGSWAVRNVTVTDGNTTVTPNGAVYDAVEASGSTGDWTVAGLNATAVGGGVDATNAAGDWVVRDTRVRNATASAVDGFNTTGDWTVRDSRVAGVETVGVNAAAADGAWTVANLTAVDTNVTAVDAGGTTGDWTVRDSRLRQTRGDAIAAVEAESDWAVRNVTVSDADGAAVDAFETAGDWVVTGLVTADTADDGVLAEEATGDWLVADSRVTRVADDAVDADETAGDWTVRNVTARDVVSEAVTADEAGGDWLVTDLDAANASRAVAAPETDGDWTVKRLTTANATGVLAANATGDWLVTDAAMAGDVGVIAPGTTGDWAVRNVTATTRSLAVGADRATGDWTVRGLETDRTDTAVTARETTGNWTITASRLRTDGTAVAAGAGEGDWVVRDSRIRSAAGAALVADGGEGDWIARNVTVRAGGVSAVRAAGDWTVRNLTVQGATDGVNATAATGDWVVRESLLFTETAGVVAAETTGVWRVTNTSILPRAVGPASGQRVGATTGVDARRATGDWAVTGSRISVLSGDGDPAAGTAVYAVDTTGAWTVTNGTLTAAGDGPTVNATGADPVGDAARNWWGAPERRQNDCVGAVDCGDRRDGSPFVDVTVTAPDEVVGSGPVEATVTVANDRRLPAAFDVATARVGANATDARRVTLAAGERQTLSVTLPTDGPGSAATVRAAAFDRGPAGSSKRPVATDRATTAVRAAFALTVENVTVSRVRPGEPVTLSVRVRNDGARSGSGVVTVETPDGQTAVAETGVQAGAGETASVELTVPAQRVRPGRLSLVVATGADRAGVTATVPAPPAVGLASATVPPAAGPNQTVTVPVDLANAGDLPGNATVRLRVGDGEQPAVTRERTVTVPPAGRSLRLGFDTGGLTGGNYTVRVSVTGQTADNATLVATERLAVQPEAPDLRVTPSNRSVGRLPLGAEQTTTVTVRNEGGATANITGVTVNGSAFRLVGSPTGPVAPGETQTVTVRVTAPTTPGTLDGRLRIESTDPDNPVASVGLSGTASGPVARTNTDRLRLFSQPVGETADATFLVSNDGTEPLSVSAVRTTGGNEFEILSERGTLTAGDTVAPGGTGEIRVAFTPAAGGPARATATVVTNDTTLNVTLTGAGQRPEATVRRDRLAFGAVGTESARTRTVTIRNDGGAALTVQNVTVTGAPAFQLVAGNGSGVLVPGETRTVTVRFQPSTAGRQTARLRVAAEGPTQPTVTLTGVGNVSDATLGTAALNFGNTGVGSSQLRDVRLTNDGNETLLVQSATVVGPDAAAFRAVTADGISVAPGASANVSVAFSPATTVDANATLRLATNDPSDPVVRVDLAGNGARADVSSSPASVAFGAVRTNTTATRTVTVENRGNATTTLASAQFADDSAASFSADDLSGSLAPGETATVNVTFAPTAGGEVTGVLAVRNATGAVVTRVSVGGVGAVPDASLNATRVSFPTTRVAGAATATVTVANDGTAPLNVSGVRATDGPFRVVDRPATVPAGGVGRVTVAFRPTATGGEIGRLRFRTDDPDGLPAVRLSGQAVTVQANVDGNVSFGEVSTGGSATETVTVENAPTATANLTVTGARLVGPDASAYSVPDTVNVTLAPGESTTVDVTLEPESGGRKFARLRLFTTDPRQPQLDTFLSNTRTVIEVDTVVANDTTGPGAEVSVENAPDNTTLPANVSSPETRRGDVGVQNLNVSVGDTEGNFSVEFTQADAPPAQDAPNFSAPDGRNVAPVKYVRVNKTLTDDEIDNATFRLRVSKVQIAESGTAPEEISLYRFVDDEWVELNGSLVGETTTHYVYSVVTPGFSDFAAGAKKPEFEITEADIPPADVSAVAIRVGDEVDILVRITNEEGAADGTFTTKLLLDDEVVEERDVTVAAGGTRQIRFVREFEGPGEFGVLVNDVSAGTVEVSARDDSSGGGDGGGSETAPLEITDRRVASETVSVGETVTFGVTVRNPDTDPKTFNADLTVAGVELVERLVSVSGRETTTVEYTRSFDRPGRYDVSVGGAFVGTVTVVEESASTQTTPTDTPEPTETQTPTPTPTEPPTQTATPSETSDPTETPDTVTETPQTATPTPSGAGEVTVVNAFVERQRVAPGTLLTVTAVVENTGTAATDRSVPLVVNGLTVARKSVSLAPGESARVTFDRRFQSVGTFVVGVGNATAGEVTVAEGTATPTVTGAPATETTATSTDTSTPGFGPAVALVALLAVALLARRRR